MKDKSGQQHKNSFIFRVYDLDLLRDMETLRVARGYRSMNELITDCVRIALPSLRGRSHGEKLAAAAEGAATVIDKKQLNRALNELFIKSVMNEKLLSGLYNIAYFEAQGMKVDEQTFKSRVLEELPAPLAELQVELEKAYTIPQRKEDR